MIHACLSILSWTEMVNTQVAIAASENSAASLPGSYVAGATAPSMMMTYAELKFIEAEANLMLGQTGPAQTAFEAAVAASVLRVTGAANTDG